MPTTLRRSAPVFVTTDLGRALAHYERLGFTVEAYEGGEHYGYACRDGIEIHLAKVESVDQSTTTSRTSEDHGHTSGLLGVMVLVRGLWGRAKAHFV